jgi:Domain of unknown function (DUF4160)
MDLLDVCTCRVSPTVFRQGPFRFFFYSREEDRIHVHVESSEGEAKFWLEPRLKLAWSYRLRRRDLASIQQLILERKNEIRAAWREHFGR